MTPCPIISIWWSCSHFISLTTVDLLLCINFLTPSIVKLKWSAKVELFASEGEDDSDGEDAGAVGGEDVGAVSGEGVDVNFSMSDGGPRR